MAGFLEKRKLRQRLYSPLAIVLLVLVAGFLGKSALDAYGKMSAAQERLDRQQAQLSELKERERELKEEVSSLQTDRGVEREIREKFDVAREGEGVIVLVDKEEPAPTEVTGESSGGLFDRVRAWFARE